MLWTPATAIFFILIAGMLVGMTVWELVSPTYERRGFLPLDTTRGDRLFIGLMTAAFVNLAWMYLTDSTQWVAFAASTILLLILIRWG